MKNIPFFKPSIDEMEFQQIESVLYDHKYSNVAQLEESMKNFIGSNHAIVVNNGTNAMHLALSSIDIKRGDKILISVNSFVNIPEVIRHFDAEPIFIDIDKESMNIDLDLLEDYLRNNISKKLKGAIISFTAGQTCDLKRLYDIKKKLNCLYFFIKYL